MKNWNDFSLPLHILNPNEFIKAFETKVDYYYGKFRELLNDNRYSDNSNLKEVLDKVIEYKEAIVKAYKFYIVGKQEYSIEIVKNMIDENREELILPMKSSKFFWGDPYNKSYFNQDASHLYLYRGRITEPYHEFQAEDLLHVPLDKRELVDTYRFSIPGIPCFYFSTNSYVLWNELKRPALDRLTISCFDLTELLDKKIIDISIMIEFLFEFLSNDLYRIKYNLTISKLIKQIKLVPLIIACSIVCDINYERKFKVEYLFPQLLMQLLNEDCIGIAYRSNRIEKGNISACNLAIPILEFDDGYKYGKIIEKIKVSDSINIGYFDSFIHKNQHGIHDANAKGPSALFSGYTFNPMTIRNSNFNFSLGAFSGLTYDGRTLYKDMVFWQFDEYLLFKNEFKKIDNKTI